jgi:hypothetical protein
MSLRMGDLFETIEVPRYVGDGSPKDKEILALLDSNGKLPLGPRQIAPEPVAPADVQQANQELSEGLHTMKRALERVDYDMRKQRPDIISDVGFHYGAHVRSRPEFYTTFREDGSMEESKPVEDKGYVELGYNFANSSAWDFTVEDGQFRVYSKSISKGQYDYATTGNSGGGTNTWGSTEMVQAVSKDQMDVIQKTLNNNKELLKGVNQLLNGIQGSHDGVANAPHLMLKELIRSSEILAMEETGLRPDKNYYDLNKAETATFYRRTARALDPNLQSTNNINTYA